MGCLKCYSEHNKNVEIKVDWKHTKSAYHN